MISSSIVSFALATVAVAVACTCGRRGERRRRAGPTGSDATGDCTAADCPQRAQSPARFAGHFFLFSFFPSPLLLLLPPLPLSLSLSVLSFPILSMAACFTESSLLLLPLSIYRPPRRSRIIGKRTLSLSLSLALSSLGQLPLFTFAFTGSISLFISPCLFLFFHASHISYCILIIKVVTVKYVL